jgi:hypothetical protein
MNFESSELLLHHSICSYFDINEDIIYQFEKIKKAIIIPSFINEKTIQKVIICLFRIAIIIFRMWS